MCIITSIIVTIIINLILYYSKFDPKVIDKKNPEYMTTICLFSLIPIINLLLLLFLIAVVISHLIVNKE